MYTINSRHKFYLCRKKVGTVILLLIATLGAYGQNNRSRNLMNYDTQWIHYGFLLGIHSSKYVTRYSDTFVTPDLDSLHSIIPGNHAGFKIGFIANMKLRRYLDFRGSITIAFYEYDLKYQIIDGTTISEPKDATILEFPLLLKYKSERRGNLRIYMLGGINPKIEASGSRDEQDTRERLELSNWDIGIDVGLEWICILSFSNSLPRLGILMEHKIYLKII